MYLSKTVNLVYVYDKMLMVLLSPAGWEEEQVSSPSILRLIFQGRFLHGNVTLGGKTISEDVRETEMEKKSYYLPNRTLLFLVNSEATFLLHKM